MSEAQAGAGAVCAAYILDSDMHRVAKLLLLASSAMAQPNYDLLLKGGHVIDAKNRIDGVRDVAISGGRVALVADAGRHLAF